MGQAKARMMELEDLDIVEGPGATICGDCIDDPVLAEYIASNASETFCSYCSRQKAQPFAMDLPDVVNVMAEVITQEWTDPANELPYESREGGYQFDVLDPYDLLDEIGFAPNNSEVLDAVASFFMGNQWCRADFFATTPAESRRFGWERFCREVMHERRYTFWHLAGGTDYDSEEIPPGRALAEIDEVISELGLIREFAPGMQFWRAQDHKTGEVLTPPSRFTSPPLDLALTPNRMSPAGIPMFYCSEDFNTAVAEVAGKGPQPGRSASGVIFQSLRPLQILDLVFLGEQVSYFAPNGPAWRHSIQFLRYFSRDISKPIDRENRQHIDYVPTQVFTEYVRFNMKAHSGHPIDGIRYFSSQDHEACFVLFFDQEDCLRSREGRPQSLEYLSGSIRTVSLEIPR